MIYKLTTRREATRCALVWQMSNFSFGSQGYACKAYACKAYQSLLSLLENKKVEHHCSGNSGEGEGDRLRDLGLKAYIVL